MIAAATLLLGALSIWFDDPQRPATAFGLVAAGLAFAWQKVVTSIAGYFVILRGSTFEVGDRIAIRLPRKIWKNSNVATPSRLSICSRRFITG